jgi:chemotaxis protein MotB
VAYADFVTAMMALFLLLWLISTVPQKKKEGLAGYMKNYNLLKPSGLSLEDKGPSPFGEDIRATGKEAAVADKGKSEEEALSNFAQEVRLELGDLQDHAVIEILDGKIRINLVDKAEEPVFPPGGTLPNDMGKKILKHTAHTIRNTGYRIAVEGHTDAHPFVGGGLSNWDLSTLRASEARKELEANGLDAARFDRVVGYASTQPLIKEDPFNPHNRRISLLLFR